MDLWSAIGSTPLLRLGRVAASLPHVTLLGKAEFQNPGGSVKDRPVRAMLKDGLDSGLLKPGKTILEATSGNTGRADAMGAALGFPVVLCLPSNASKEKQKLLRTYGASLELTSPLEGTDGAQRRAKEMFASDPARYFYPDQYSNDANWRAHFETTGPEIWEETQGRVTHFVTGLGTSGTFVGASRYLKSKNPAIVCVSLEPDTPLHGLEGLKHMATAAVPRIYDATIADARIEMATEEAYSMTRRLAKEEGLFVGISSGANVAGALRVSGALPREVPAVVVTLLCDGGARYISDRFWEG